MPQKDGSKEIAFAMWLERDRVNQIIAKVTAKPDTVRTWVREWERGRQGVWEAQVLF